MLKVLPCVAAWSLSSVIGLGSLAAQSLERAEPQLPPMESVFRISTSFGDGSGFLVDARGLVLTNAHVVAAHDSVEVQIDESYKVVGAVLLQDEEYDVAVVRVHPESVVGLPVLPLSDEAARDLMIGEPILVVGFPLGGGRTLTRGILSRSMPRTLVTDASVSPGNSGGPMFDGQGRVVGLASFLMAETVGPGLGGGVSAVQISAIVERIGSRFVAEPPPPRDSLPVMPTDVFPLAQLRAMRDTRDWPLDAYDISNDDHSISNRYEARIFTPLVQHFLDLQRGGRAEVRGGGELLFTQDLRYWSLDLGAYSPVVIVRITPKVGQSGTALLGNLLLGALAGATRSYFSPIDDPEFRGSVRSVSIMKGTTFVRPIQTRIAWSVLNGQAAQAAYVVIDPGEFCSTEGRATSWSILSADADRYLAPFPIPERTQVQVCRDFEGYLASRE